MKLRRTSSDRWKLSYVSESDSSTASAAVSVSVSAIFLDVTEDPHSILLEPHEEDVFEDVDLNSEAPDVMMMKKRG
jgi:hypothetical protein